jgi:hypothetical protein
MLAASAALGSSEKCFRDIQGFDGKWAIRSGQKTLLIEMRYESGSKGSIVTEQFGKELSVFYRDGPKLVDDTLLRRWQSATVATEGEYPTWGL